MTDAEVSRADLFAASVRLERGAAALRILDRGGSPGVAEREALAWASETVNELASTTGTARATACRPAYHAAVRRAGRAPALPLAGTADAEFLHVLAEEFLKLNRRSISDE